MATSGTVVFSETRDELITDALLDVGLVPLGYTAEADLINYASRTLNAMLKAWMADGLNLWKTREFTLFLVQDQVTYSLGSTGDHATETYSDTEIRIAGVTNDTIIQVDSTTGMIVGDYIGIELDSGNMHWTTIASITDADTVVITSGIPSATAINNTVYFYTTKIVRPLEVMDLVLRSQDDIDTPVNLISRNEYYMFSSKTSEGTPNDFYFQPKLTNSALKVYPEPLNGNYRLVVTGRFPIEDLTSASHDFDCPNEWLLAIRFNLAKLMAPGAALPSSEYKKLASIAMEEYERVLGFDKESVSTYLQPDLN